MPEVHFAIFGCAILSQLCGWYVLSPASLARGSDGHKLWASRYVAMGVSAGLLIAFSCPACFMLGVIRGGGRRVENRDAFLSGFEEIANVRQC